MMTASNSAFGPGSVFQVVPVDGARQAVQGGPQGGYVPFQGYPDVMGVSQAAEALDVSQKWLREAIARGDVKSFRVGRLIKVPKSALVDFIDRGGAA